MPHPENPLLAAHQRLGALQSPFAEAERLRRGYSYAVPTAEAIAELVAHSPIVEVGAGHGYWASLAARAGAHVVAYDDPCIVCAYTSGPAHYPVEPGGPECLRNHPAYTLFLGWPPRADSFALECLHEYTGSRLIYAGPEGAIRAHAGSERFHLELETDWRVVRRIALPPWPEPALQGNLRLYERLS